MPNNNEKKIAQRKRINKKMIANNKKISVIHKDSKKDFDSNLKRIRKLEAENDKLRKQKETMSKTKVKKKADKTTLISTPTVVKTTKLNIFRKK